MRVMLLLTFVLVFLAPVANATSGWFSVQKCAWQDGNGSATSPSEEIAIKDCEVQPSSEQTQMSGYKSKWNAAGEGSACVDLAGQEYGECLEAGANDPSCKLAASTPPSIDPGKPNCGLESGIYGSLSVFVERFVAESNCARLREKCIRDVMVNRESLCGAMDATAYRTEVFNHINERAQCLSDRAAQSESAGKTFLASVAGSSSEPSAMESSRAIGYNDTITCDTKPGYRHCQFAQTVTEVATNPDTPPIAPPPLGAPEPGAPVVTSAVRAAPLVPNTCAGTILGDGVTVITSPTCQVMGSAGASSAPMITIQSVSATGEKVTAPATCQATSSSNSGEAVQCSLMKTMSAAAPVYKLETDNRVKSCRTSGWTVTCPDSAVEAALQRRVKILGVSGEAPLKQPIEGYAHYSRRTGKVTTASTGKLRSNGVMMEIAGKPVMAFSRAPASIAPTGDAYSMDKFVLQTSRTPLTEELETAGAPLMREISLGDK